MVSDEKFVTKTSKGEELDGKKAPGRTGAERTGKMSRRACYFEGCDIISGLISDVAEVSSYLLLYCVPN